MLDENYREGNVYNYSGNKKQQPVQGKKANLDDTTNIMPSDGRQPIVRRESEIVNGPLNSQLNGNRPSFKPGEPFTFSTGRDLDDNDKGVDFVSPIT